jgi:hypothetical protein
MARIILQLNTCGHSPYVTSSLTRGWVCRLPLLLALSSAFILRSEFGRTHDHIVLSQIRDYPPPGAPRPVFISPRNRVAQLYPPALGSLSVAFYYSQGYGGGNLNPPPYSGGSVYYALTLTSQNQVKVKVTLRLTVGQSVSLGVEAQIFIIV